MIFTASGYAGAYELQHTDAGDVKRWFESCMYYSINVDGARDLDFERVREAIRASFDTWEDVECSYFYFVETEPTSCRETGFNDDRGNVNVLYWVKENWDKEIIDDERALAFTIVSVDKDTGAILDTDIKFNAERLPFGLNGEEGKTDLINTATHEIGHVYWSFPSPR